MQPGGKQNGRLRRLLKDIGLSVATVIAMSVLGLALMTAVMLVPNSVLVERLDSAFNDGMLGPDYTTDLLGGRHNWWSECTGLTIGIVGESGSGNPLRRAVTTPTLTNCEQARPSIAALAAGSGDVEASEYFRYWHGYAVVTRPGLAVFDLGGTRVIVGSLMLAALGLLFALVSRAAGLLAATVMLAPLVLTSNLTVLHLEPTQASPLVVAVFGAAAAFLAVSRPPPWLVVAATATGGAVALTDRLTVAALSWALTAFMVGLATWLSDVQVRPTLLASGRAAVFWAIGFSGVWSSKWLLAALALGPATAWENVSGGVTERVAGVDDDVSQWVGAAILKNLRYWIDAIGTTPLVVIIGAIGALVTLSIWVWQRRAHTIAVAAALGVPVMIIVVWLELLRNHSQTHEFITYRHLPMAMGLVLASLVVAARSTAAKPATLGAADPASV